MAPCSGHQTGGGINNRLLRNQMSCSRVPLVLHTLQINSRTYTHTHTQTSQAETNGDERAVRSRRAAETYARGCHAGREQRRSPCMTVLVSEGSDIWPQVRAIPPLCKLSRCCDATPTRLMTHYHPCGPSSPSIPSILLLPCSVSFLPFLSLSLSFSLLWGEVLGEHVQRNEYQDRSILEAYGDIKYSQDTRCYKGFTGIMFATKHQHIYA